MQDIVILWIDNDKPMNDFVLSAANKVWKKSLKAGPDFRSNWARTVLGDDIREKVVEGVPNLEGIYADFITHAISQVNWNEVAHNYLKEKKNYVAKT